MQRKYSLTEVIDGWYGQKVYELTIEGLAGFGVDYSYGQLTVYCNGNTKYISNLIKSVFGSNYYYKTCSAEEAKAQIDCVISAIDALNASMLEEEALKKERAKIYAREYAAKRRMAGKPSRRTK